MSTANVKGAASINVAIGEKQNKCGAPPFSAETNLPELGISLRTVEVHRARMIDKLGVRSVPELVRLVIASRSEVA